LHDAVDASCDRNLRLIDIADESALPFIEYTPHLSVAYVGAEMVLAQQVDSISS
jgi:hypothetical protein